MYSMSFTKNSFDLDSLTSDINHNISLEEGNSLMYIGAIGNIITLNFISEPDEAQKTQISSIVTSHSNNTAIIGIIQNAIRFGQSIIIEFAAENVAMGITQDGMTKTVRENTVEIVNALLTGSLYDAATAIKTLDASKKDPKYITDARLLKFLNKIESYLGIPLSTAL